ncbi:MAG: LLM class flavin-dependent oxidoreductase, partial [Ilumatobacteraceae bacterium]
MTRLRPFRFGIQADGAPTGTEWADLARRAEHHGYSCLTMPDHFGDQLAPVPALMAAAAATTTLRVGALVFDNDYKHPVVLAKELATIDVLSDGRLEIGLGAGWLVKEYEALGIPFPSAGERIALLRETVECMKAAYSGEPLDYRGDYVTSYGYTAVPPVIQRPHPPILIGGGAPKVLGLA